MEQHNIDSRFKEGLENISRQPSADAWARLQSRMQEAPVAPVTEETQPEEKEERKVIAWWYYAAAAVVVFLISVGILKNSIVTGPESMPVAVNQTTATEDLETTETMPVVLEKSETERNAIAQNSPSKFEQPVSESTVTEDKVSTKGITFKAQNGTVQVAKTKNSNSVSPTIQGTEVKISEAKPEKLETQKPEENAMLAVNTPQNKVENQPANSGSLGGMAIEIIVKKDQTSEALAANTNVTEKPANKPVLLKNIFKQAVNLKNGDGVNLQALGLNENSKLAQGTRTLHDKVTKVLDI